MTLDTDKNLFRSLVLGIDTGGTYTDGVLLEYHSRQVLATHKSLTTKRDLSLGIEKVIEGIHIKDPAEIGLVSISTTLATNAIAEDKGKRVALLLVGYDPDLIAAFKMAGRFATPYYYYFRGGHNLYGQEKEALDLSAILAKVSEIQGQVDAVAVSSYYSPLNPEHENRVYQAVSGMCDLPIVLGHQLSTNLGSVERATTAALNASLLVALQDFVVSVRRAMERRRIGAPLMIVRGDGTLMSDEFAARVPVETIHSGPAASAMGGRFLSRLGDALVIDIGGTTTDIALIQGGQVAVTEEGATVGDYKTCVKAANLLSIALGGDSHITYNHEKKIAIGPERVVPLAYLAWQYPDVRAHLASLAQRTWSPAAPESLEYWFLLREPQDESLLQTVQERALVDLLRRGPQPVPDLLNHLKLLHPAQIGARDLLRQEIIGKSGLTPTDLLHVEGQYAPWDVVSARHAVDVFGRFSSFDSETVRQQIRSRMTEEIVRAIVTLLSGRKLGPPALPHDDDLGRWFFYNSLCPTHPQLETSFRLQQPIVGIGAPAGIFLPQVARVLHTDLVLPEHYQVANAVGAIAGSVMVTEEILVYPHFSGSGLEVMSYYVQTSENRQEFGERDSALAYARALAQERALGAALRSGADSPRVTVEEAADGLDAVRIQAKAFGNPRLGH